MTKQKKKKQPDIQPVPREEIAAVGCEEDFVELLRRELEWPIPMNVQRLSDVAIPHDLQKDFGFKPDEDRIAVSRLLSLTEDQPWGVFLFEFKTKRPYLSHLRRLLRVLGSQRTLRKGDPIWDRNDLLFICTQDWSQFHFVHFSGEKPESAVISTFGWKGPDDPFLYTLCRHNLPRLRMPQPTAVGNYDADIWRTAWRDAFSLKPVTDEFYATLKEVFDAVQEGVDGLTGEDRRFFAELVVNRMIFLKFVEKKGWLNNDRNYLYNQFQEYGQDNFWNYFLCDFFFEGLCKVKDQRSPKVNALLGDIPFLNAELFAPSTKWDEREVRIENRVFDLLFDKLLNPYNFTVCETSPLEVEVAFNQDLLGYGYEELIADQHGQGAYYTHPTEVNLMCRESLRAYLEGRCPKIDKTLIGRLVYAELNEADQVAETEALALYRALHTVTVVDPALGSGTFPVAMMKHLFLALRTLGDHLRQSQEFKKLIQDKELTDPENAFALKLHIIEQSIYGCDIDYFAVEIAKLRFWIELMVDCENPEALPNFKCKLVVGDALVSVVGSDDKGNLITLEKILGHPTRSGGQGNLLHYFGKQTIEKLAKLKRRYFKVEDTNEREVLEEQIAKTRDELLKNAGVQPKSIKRTDKHVLWQIDFAEIFSGKLPGFDIAIANPPYLRKEEIDALFNASGIFLNKSLLRKTYANISGLNVSGHADIYIYFYLRAISLLKQEGGVLSFITSNAWLDVGYGGQLQEHLLLRSKTLGIIEDRYHKAFGAADVNAVIVNLTLGEPSQDTSIARFVVIRNGLAGWSQAQSLHVFLRAQQATLNRDIRVFTKNYGDLLFEGHDTREKYVGSKWGGKYLRAPDSFHQLLNQNEHLKLGNLAKVGTYLNTGGCDDFFFLKIHSKRDSLVLVSSQKFLDSKFWIEEDFVIPLVRTPSAHSCPLVRVAELDTYLLRIPAETDLKRLKVREYVEWGEAKGYHKRSGSKNRFPWWRLPIQAQHGAKVLVSRHHHNHLNVLWNPDQAVANSFYSIVPLNEVITPEGLFAYLSSSLGVMFAEVYGRTNQGQGVLNTYGEDIEQIPILKRFVERCKCVNKCCLSFSIAHFQPYDVESGLSIKKGGVVSSHERGVLDECVMDAAGISPAQWAQLVQDTSSLMAERIGRAKRGTHE